MAVFECVGCGAGLTARLTEVPLPGHAHQMYGHELMPALMEPGTYAVDPEAWGPPWRKWDEVGEEEAAARGIYAPVYSLSYGAKGWVVIAPGDGRGMRLIPERLAGYCYGVDGREGPNLACEGCGKPVATRIDDCALWQEVRLYPAAVRAVPSVERPVPEADIPPVTAAGRWDPRWEAEVGITLAHLVAASGGAPLTVPSGLWEKVFAPALEVLLPTEGEPKVVGLTDDTILVGRQEVPFAPAMVRHLTLPLVPDRDEDTPAGPWFAFEPDVRVFLDTLVRMPAVREPWLREIYDRVEATKYRS
jgi:hypothetical protein